MTPDQLIANIKDNILNPIIIFLFALSLLFFLWGVYEFIVQNAASAEKREDGKRHMLWGIVGMAIMASAFGLTNLICNTIDCKNPAYTNQVLNGI